MRAQSRLLRSALQASPRPGQECGLCTPRPRRVGPRALPLRAAAQRSSACARWAPPAPGLRTGPGPPAASQRAPGAPQDPPPPAAAPGSSLPASEATPPGLGLELLGVRALPLPSHRSAGAGGQDFCGSHSCLLTREQRQRAACEQWDQSGSLTREWSQGPCMPHVPPRASSSFLSILIETHLYFSVSYCILSAVMHEIGFVHDLHFYFFLWPVNRPCCF